MKKKPVKTISELVSDVLYENCCKGKLCSNCKYDTTDFNCYISTIILMIEKYEKENEL